MAQRIDKWLWYARFFKTRSLAAKVVTGGKVRITREGRSPCRVDTPSTSVHVGDVLTFPQAASIRVVKVIDPGTRRGPAPEAQGLYEDLSPPVPRSSGEDGAAEKAGQPALRAAGSGRPTKRDRRAIDRLKDAP